VANTIAKINFGNNPANDTFGFWTNVLAILQGSTVPIFNFATGAVTGALLTITDEPQSSDVFGVNAVGTGAAAWVDEPICSVNYHTVNLLGDNLAAYDISGLDDALKYNIRAFASSTIIDAVRVGEYSIDGFSTTQEIDASGNSTIIAEFLDVVPVGGVISLSFRTKAANTSAYLNAVEIEQIEAETAIDTIPINALPIDSRDISSLPI
jgi:hypothetical protein